MTTLSWYCLVPLVWLGSILLMFPVFYMAMLGLHFLEWAKKCLMVARPSRQKATHWALMLPVLLDAAVVLLCAIYDVIVNWTSVTILFLDLPRERMVTTRLERYKRGTGWRKRVADRICTKCLDWADPNGKHCK